MEGKYFVLVINPTVITAFGKINECKQCNFSLWPDNADTHTHTLTLARYLLPKKNSEIKSTRNQ